MSKTIMISAGEASGDLHAANLVKALHAQDADVNVIAMGSDKLKEAGAELLVDCRDIAVVGLVEVVKHYGEIKAALNLLKDNLKTRKPDLLILVDYVEFNLKLAAEAKKQGIKTLFYVSPQVWAWRKGRVPKIGQVVDMMAVIFPFETDIYKEHNIPCRYVGHPLVDEVKTPHLDNAFYQQYHLDKNRPIVALLPGSRGSEIQRILPTIIASAHVIQHADPHVQFVLPIAPTLSRKDIDAVLGDHHLNKLVIAEGESQRFIAASSSTIVASGTATLEVALLNTPMAIVYKVNSLTYKILRPLIKLPHIGLANIVGGREVVPEFVQDYANPYLIAHEVLKQLHNEDYHQELRLGLKMVKDQLGNGGGSHNVASLALEMLGAQP